MQFANILVHLDHMVKKLYTVIRQHSDPSNMKISLKTSIRCLEYTTFLFYNLSDKFVRERVFF